MTVHLNKNRLVVVLAATLSMNMAMAANPVGNAAAWDMDVHIDLIGLAPTREEARAFADATTQNSQEAWEAAVDRLLDSPRFGEKWARHWMDWLRCAETHGSEGDPKIPFVWRYRDYLVRALIADVPLSELIRVA